MAETIFALSSGGLPSGVAIIRLSGPHSFAVAKSMCGDEIKPRVAQLRTLSDPHDGRILDEALVLFFPSPNSFTGEDVVEFHCHGGVATVDAVLDVLGHQVGCRLAESGEFSKRAFENGRLDLTEVEGLSDLIAAQTENQRRLALAQSSGQQRTLYENWREELVRCRALIEAELDFADEDDVPGSVSDQVWERVDSLRQSIGDYLKDQRRGEIIRDGYKIVLAGPPNAGKSSLLNALARREVAIVTPQAGTTRDVLEVSLDMDGQLVTIFDTAGIRETDDIVEREGIRRAHAVVETADMTLWLQPVDSDAKGTAPEGALFVYTKADLNSGNIVNENLTVSTITPGGLDSLLDFISSKLEQLQVAPEQPLVTRQRHRSRLESCIVALAKALQGDAGLDIRSEHLRLAADDLGRLTGRIDVEDLLDVIFSEFCVGK